MHKLIFGSVGEEIDVVARSDRQPSPSPSIRGRRFIVHRRRWPGLRAKYLRVVFSGRGRNRIAWICR
jgi:hypothetical protein